MKLKVETKDSYIIANPSGKIDATNADEFTNSLIELLKNKKNLILNFEDVNYISSAGLRSILIAAKEANNSNIKFVLCSLQDQIYEIFKMTGFTQMLNIVNSLSEAESLVKNQHA